VSEPLRVSVTLDKLPELLADYEKRIQELRQRVKDLEARGRDELAEYATVEQLVTRYDWLAEGTLRDHLKYRDTNGLGKHVIGKRPLLIHVGGYTRWLRERGRRRSW
jgi:siroheme synthase